MKVAPCKDCEKRVVGCHSSCEDFVQWEQEHREEKERLREAKMKSSEYLAYRKEEKDKRAHIEQWKL